MNRDKEVLIIGAGSTGLSSAVFLSDAGFNPRIVDKRSAPSDIAKAIGVNPNTLRLLEPSGITKRFIENGWKLEHVNYWAKNKIVYKNDYTKIKHPFPFMLIQPQCDTESIIEEELARRNIFVERNMELESISESDGVISSGFKNANGKRVNIDTNGIVIGADGSHSKVREELGIKFEGWEHKELFTLYDIELETPINHKEGHYMFFKESGMIMLHIRDGVWRVGGNIPDVLNYLPAGTKTGKIKWETTFTVSEKVASTFSSGNVFILGDAAHIHSPAGAKGMNTCIEDAHIFAGLAASGRETEFTKVRRPAIKRSVGIIGQLTDKIGGNNFIGQTVRNNFNLFGIFFPLIMPRMRKFLLGLK